MEKFRHIGRLAGGIYNKLSAKALNVVLKAHEATGSKGNRFIQAGKRVLIDTQAHSSTIVVDNHERLDQLKSVGLTEGHISTIVLAHLFLDYALPPFLIAAAYPIIHGLTGLPPTVDATIAFFAARAGYGIVTGTTREILYTLLPAPINDQPIDHQ